MNIVELAKNKFVVGLKWYVFDDEQDVKEKVKELKSEKKKWKIFKKDDLIFLAVSDQDIKKYKPLAYQILDKEPGLYTVKFDDDNCWIFVKGTDGGILFDEYGNCNEIFRQNESELYDYRATLSTFELTKEQLEKDILEKVGKSEEEKGKKRAIIMGVVASAVIIAGILIIKHIIEVRHQEALARQLAREQALMARNKPKPVKMVATKQIGKIDIDKCYSEWFAKALYYSNDTQTCGFIGQQNITEKDLNSLDLPNCVKTAKAIYKLALYGGLTLTWGAVEQFGKAKILNFKISGVVYKPMAEKFKNYYFVLPAQVSLYGSPSNPVLTLQGGLLCE